MVNAKHVHICLFVMKFQFGKLDMIVLS